ncbi:MAG: penicillin-binding transpeptidase domain-containing protein, partial [Firmicutes bacterium]|nr:penicillin-binding transpeptidase domain-containing protein [Bacillota bacterium]
MAKTKKNKKPSPGGRSFIFQSRLKRRVKVVGVLLTLCLAALAARIGYIKVAFGNEYERTAVIQAYNSGNSVEEVVTPNRGAILDRNMQPLAVSEIVYTVILDIRTLATLDDADIAQTIGSLSDDLKMPLSDIDAVLAKNDDGTLVNDTRYYQLARQVPAETANTIKNRKLKCVYLVDDTKRSYVYGTFAPQVIGFERGDPTANWGLENSYNSDLSGIPGRIFRIYDQEGGAVTEDVPAIAGYTLVTTLDQDIQNICQSSADALGKQFQPQYASVSVMNPNTCEVLGMAQYPSFSDSAPSDPGFFTNDAFAKAWDKLPQDEQSADLYQAWVNYNLTRSFEPGSIFKPITVAAALEEGLISENSTFYCGGYKDILGVRIPCWIYNSTGGGHGEENLTRVLANSCNVGLMDIAQILGRDLFFKYRNDFGYGEKTGIDLPGEASVSDPSVMYPLSALNPVELATSSFGQGSNCTVIQAMTAFSAIINGGNLMKPYVVSQVLDSDGNVVRTNSPEVVRKPISKETSDIVRRMLGAVVRPNGTGYKAVIDGYSMGGKTGTAQQGVRAKGEYVVSFIAFLPVDDPQYLALVLIDRPAGNAEVQGSTSAGPMMRSVMQEIIKAKSIRPDVSAGDAGSGANSLGEAVVPDYTGMSLAETTKSLNGLGMDYSVFGSGSVVNNQFPLAGEQAPAGSRILIYVSNPAGGESGLTAVPRVVGLSADEAVAKITESGLVPVPYYGNVSGGGSDTANPGEPVTSNAEPGDNAAGGSSGPAGVVYEQMPDTEAMIQQGTEVKLKIRF